MIALPLSNIVWGYAAAAETYRDFATSLSLFAPGLVFFTVHYLMLRGFYALERTRTVFWVQCVIAATNVAVAVAVTSQVGPQDTAPGLVVAYVAAYAVGAALSYLLLRRLLGGLETPVLVRFLVRMAIAAGLAGGGGLGLAGPRSTRVGDRRRQGAGARAARPHRPPRPRGAAAAGPADADPRGDRGGGARHRPAAPAAGSRRG